MTEAETNEKTTISVVYCKPGERAETVEMEENLKRCKRWSEDLFRNYSRSIPTQIPGMTT